MVCEGICVSLLSSDLLFMGFAEISKKKLVEFYSWSFAYPTSKKGFLYAFGKKTKEQQGVKASHSSNFI